MISHFFLCAAVVWSNLGNYDNGTETIRTSASFTIRSSAVIFTPCNQVIFPVGISPYPTRDISPCEVHTRVYAQYSGMSITRADPAPSSRLLRTVQQITEIVIHARHTEIRLPLEGVPQVMDPMGAIPKELHDGKDEIFRFVEGV